MAGTPRKREDKREKVPLSEWEKEKVKEHADKNEVSKAEYMATAIRQIPLPKQIERDIEKSAENPVNLPDAFRKGY